MSRSALSGCAIGAALTLSLGVPSAYAAPSVHLDRASFDAANNAINTENLIITFDEFDDEVVLPSGSQVEIITFVYDFSGTQLEVRKIEDASTFDTTSPPFTLVSTDAGVLQDGDDLTLNFSQRIHGFGLYVTSADELIDGDFVLSAGGVDAVLESTQVEGTLADGADVYFLGIVNPQQSFLQATLTTPGNGEFLYSIDDIEVAAAPDSDSDGAANAVDNCLLRANPDQVDSDGDNIGNACDADIRVPNDCVVNVLDLGFLRVAFFGTPGSANWNPDADFNGDGVVNVQDLGILRQQFFMAPGPSALPNACAP